ncbi:tRNA pseudouridine(13) synthase TruD [Aliiglaciecola sp. LCG003]|uniref:tRNA pseudouridine(13) synthase TruD n=1 Tax=Aliiglaciecola sp. LCG003 TaxID=3053655 RepID=UPI002572E7A1|nr:tRNA pseudouridine(13) synthase TruD [Aliiglaciecola sp. LCG003]WJG09042.1 tRNA pseudouridine(13) synthase TruD [Aliiglaciecola sp. LCG003]
MVELSIDNWGYWQGKPPATGALKAHPEDFVVKEVLGYEPDGQGEHIYLWVEKSGLNTAYVAEQLAKFCQLPLRAITYAGRKDKHALTQQWFGVHMPGKKGFDWDKLNLAGLIVLEVHRHSKKLRVGNLKGNRFELTVRDLSSDDQIQQRLETIAQHGVPNYFGPQRFGETRHHSQGGNLALAQGMLNGEPVRNRNKRSMAISALRSWLFNQYVEQRRSENKLDQALLGDVCILSGSNSFFCVQQQDTDIAARLASDDIKLSAPMWGAGELASEQQAKQYELGVAAKYPEVCSALADLGLKQERRAIVLKPQDLQWQIESNTLKVQFMLPAGCFATSVLREVINTAETS